MLEIEIVHISIFSHPLMLEIKWSTFLIVIDVNPLFKEQQEVKIRQTWSQNPRIVIQPLMLKIEMAYISIFIQPLMIDIEVFDIFYCIHFHPLLQQLQEVKIRRT